MRSVRPGVLSFLALVAAAAHPARAATPDELEARSYRDDAARVTLPYRLFVPEGYDPAQPYPLVLFLHGAGERGTDNISQLDHDGVLVFTDPGHQATDPCFLVAPQLAGTYNGWHLVLEQVNGLLLSIQGEFNIDPDRIYVTGVSMGGAGAFYMTMSYPDTFAAAMPMSGWGSAGVDRVKHIPFWFFHGALDETVDVQETRDLVAALRAAEGTAAYTELARGGHVIWEQAYHQPGIVEWMMSQRYRARSAVGPAINVEGEDNGVVYTATTAMMLSGSVDLPFGTINSVDFTHEALGDGTMSGTREWSVLLPLYEGDNYLTLHATGPGTTLTRPLKVVVDPSLAPPPVEPPPVMPMEMDPEPMPVAMTPEVRASAGNDSSGCSAASGQALVLPYAVVLLLALAAASRRR